MARQEVGFVEDAILSVVGTRAGWAITVAGVTPGLGLALLRFDPVVFGATIATLLVSGHGARISWRLINGRRHVTEIDLP